MLINTKFKEFIPPQLNLFRTLINLSSRTSLDMAKEWDQADPDEKLRKALVLHLALRNTSWLNSRFSADIIRRLEAWSTYNSIISKIAEAPEPSRIIVAQRLLGFKPTKQGVYMSSFVVSDVSIVYEGAKAEKVATERNSQGELIVSARWVDRLAKEEFRKRLHKQLRDIHTGLIRSGWTALYIFRPQVKPNELSEPVTHATTSDRGFKARLNATATAIKAFAPVCHLPEAGSQLTSLLRLWVRRLFDLLNPANGIFEEMSLISPHPNRSIFRGIWACARQYLLPPSNPQAMSQSFSVFFSMLVIGHSLVTHLQLEDLDSCVSKDSKLKPCSNIQTDACAKTSIEEEYSVRNQLVSFFNQDDANGLSMVTDMLKYVDMLGTLGDSC